MSRKILLWPVAIVLGILEWYVREIKKYPLGMIILTALFVGMITVLIYYGEATKGSPEPWI